MATTVTDGKVFPAFESQPKNASSKTSDASSDDSFAGRKTDWRSIYLCTLVCFCGQVQFSLFLNSQFAFMKTLDPTVTEGFFGIIIGSLSLMQMLFSPLLGIWANRIKQLRQPLIMCNATMVVGNLMYLAVDWFPVPLMKYVMLVSRLVCGIGPAQNSLLIAFSASASTNQDRSKATAWITCGLALGITIGPSFQWLFTFLGFPGWQPISWLHLNMFTAPAYFAVAMNIIIHFLLQFFFRESSVGILDSSNQKQSPSDVENPVYKLPPYDRWALAVCCAMKFTQYLIFTNLETIGTSYAMMMFGFSSTSVVTYESFAHTVRGLITMLVYAMYIVFNLGDKINERLMCLLSLFGLLAFHVITYPWPYLPSNVVEYDSSNLTMPQLGCESNVLGWCHGLSQVNVWVYYVAIVVCIGLAFPNINATMIPLISRVIGPRMQTKEQGILEMCGGLGRMLGPSVIGQLYHSYGPRPIWILESVEISLMILLWLICYRRLVPLKLPNRLIGTKAHQRIQKAAPKMSCAGSLT